MAETDEGRARSTIHRARIGAHLLLVGAFGIVVVGIGHRALPVGLLLVSGPFEGRGATLALGWGGVALLLAAAVLPGRAAFRWTTVASTGLLLGAWASLLPTTDLPIFTFMTAVPFLTGAIARLVLLPWKKPAR